MYDRLVINRRIHRCLLKGVRKEKKNLVNCQSLFFGDIEVLFLISPIVRNCTTRSPRVTEPPQPEAEASVAKAIRICRSSQGIGSSPVRKKSQCEISPLRALSILRRREVRKALEIAAFISLVIVMPLVLSMRMTHLPAKCWRLLAKTTELVKIC